MTSLLSIKQAASLTLIALAVAATPALAARGDIKAGEDKAVTCQACHGLDGIAVDPQYPHLAGQYRDYLVRALQEYKSGNRKNPIMMGFASTLQEQDMLDLAAYYASLPGKLTDLHGLNEHTD